MKFFIFCLLIFTQNIVAENDHDFRALIVLGHSDFQVTKNAYAQEFLNASVNVPSKNEASFMIFHSDETFLLEKHFDQTFIQSHFLNESTEKRLVIVSTKGTNEMSLDELQLFRELIYYLNGGLIVLEIGKSTTQTSVILEHSTFCWGKTSIEIGIPNTVILCNDIKTTNVPFLRNSKISTIFDTNKNNLNDGDIDTFVQATLITWPTILPSAMAAEQNFDKKRPSKRTIQPNERELYYKSEKKVDESVDGRVDERVDGRVDESVDEVVDEIDGDDDKDDKRQMSEDGKRRMREKMLKRCRWRKSCLETGQIPELKDFINFDFLKWFKSKDSDEITKNNPNHEGEEIKNLDDYQKKYKCHYRPSCYAKNDMEMSDINKKKSTGVLTSKASHFKSTTKPQMKKRTVKDLANIAIKKVEEKSKTKSPKTKISKMEKHFNEMEEKLNLKVKCHYRKSCIQSNGNVKPEIDGYKIPKWLTTEWMGNVFSEKWSKFKKKEIKPFEEQNLEERKLFCKYRKSCFETGELPKIEKGTNFKLKHVVEQAKSVVKVNKEQACKYRKSCYKTGVLPIELQKKEKPKEEIPKTKVVKPAPRNLEELKLQCKYRPSCYRKKVEELENQHVDVPEIHIKQGKKVQEEEPMPEIQVEETFVEEPEVIDEIVEVIDEPIEEEIEEPPKKQKKFKPKVPKIQEEEVEPPPPVPVKKFKKTKKSTSAEIEQTENFQEEVPSKQKKTKKGKSEEVMEPEIIQENKKEEEVKSKSSEVKSASKVKKPKSSEVEVEAPKAEKPPKVEPTPPKQTPYSKAKPESKKADLKTRLGDSFVAKALHFFHSSEKSKKQYTAEEWENLPLPEKQKYCKYRKHCLETGELPKFGPGSTQTIRENPRISIQQKCHWRKSCIAAMQQHETETESKIIDDRALPINKIKVETPQKTSEKQKTEKETTQTKTEKKSKKSTKSKSAEVDETEEQFKEIPQNDSEHENIQEKGKHLAKNMSTNLKLALKYRLSSYVLGHMNESYIPAHLRHTGKCSKYRLSCREQLGLPPIEKAPIGPNGKKLCRKKDVKVAN